MRTVGEMLRSRRIEKRLSLESVEKVTKIRSRFLTAIESDEYGKLPSRAYAEGFIKTYGKYLGFKEHDILAFFRRQIEEPTRTSILPARADTTLKETRFRLTPSRFLGLILIGFFAVFALYFGFQYKSLHAPAKLVIEKPQDSFTVSDEYLDVIGETDPDATITVQGISVLVRGDGKFFDQVKLVEGVNTITIVATSRLGNATTITKSGTFLQN